MSKVKEIPCPHCGQNLNLPADATDRLVLLEKENAELKEQERKDIRLIVKLEAVAKAAESYIYTLRNSNDGLDLAVAERSWLISKGDK